MMDGTRHAKQPEVDIWIIGHDFCLFLLVLLFCTAFQALYHQNAPDEKEHENSRVEIETNPNKPPIIQNKTTKADYKTVN
ncbi:uncharacterized protein G2W53_039113 [Senna tora]|uniref:Uncharacterized protein n=1 Tax=Senna tora TaxID=362788 RepID=A0A834SN74_9FABA|nr:uncharacterized protein G2W53_039113 [Senna tora]